MAIKSALWGMGGALALAGLISAPALAGTGASCAVGSACHSELVLLPSPVGHSGPMTVQNRTPYDFLDSVHFQRAPHVNITRVHGMMPTASIEDAPVGFHGDCHPESTVYCRGDHAGHVGAAPVAPVVAPPAPRPYIAPPPAVVVPQPVAPQPVVPQPVVQAPVERVVAVGGGYDPSKFAPRTYGDPHTITLGIAHVPTSIVDRDPARAQAVLDSGQAAPNPWTPGGTTPALTGAPMQHMNAAPQMSRPVMAPPVMRAPVMPAPVMQAPQRPAPVVMVPAPMVQTASPQPVTPMMRGPVPGSIPTGQPGAAGAPIVQANGQVVSPIGADGTYWDRVSGPTVVGGLPATQVICKRRLPSQIPVTPLAGAPHPVAPLPPVCDGPRGRY